MRGAVKSDPGQGKKPVPAPPGPPAPPAPPTWLVAAMLAAAAGVVYANSLSVPFSFDDYDSIINNPTIRQWWPPQVALLPPAGGEGAMARPLVNYSLAVNYALGGFRVQGYHLANLVFHFIAALALFGCVRRSLLQPLLRGRYGPVATTLGAVVALLWLVHPLLTESVTCVIQRTESLMGLFYLLTFYTAIRALTAARPGPWPGLCVAFCLAGMATKEVMVSAPLLILLYDRTLVAGTFRAAWKARRGFYLALGATWIPLAWFVIGLGAGTRGNTCGFNGGIAWWEYLDTQAYAITRYLWLSLVPYPLVVDYGSYLVHDWRWIVGGGLVVVSLLAATGWALVRKPAWGLLGAWFFCILAPSSSFLPLITQTIAEHRMYLPLIAVVLPFVLGLQHALPRAWLPVSLAAALALAAGTVRRNYDYRTPVALWTSTVRHWPVEPRPHANLGTALLNDRHAAREAVAQFDEAVALRPTLMSSYANRALAWAEIPGGLDHVVADFQQALAAEPGNALWHANFARALARGHAPEADIVREAGAALRLPGASPEIRASAAVALAATAGNFQDGIRELRSLAAADPSNPARHLELGTALANAAGWAGPASAAWSEEATAEFRRALALDPTVAEAHVALGAVLAKVPATRSDGLAELRVAIRMDPALVRAHGELAAALLAAGDVTGGLAELEEARRLDANAPELLNNAAAALAKVPGRQAQAVGLYEDAIRLRPDYWEARYNLGMLLLEGPVDLARGLRELEEVTRLAPNFADAHTNLAQALAGQPGRFDDAVRHFTAAAELQPDSPDVHFNLGVALKQSPGREADALAQIQWAVRLRPDDADASFEAGQQLAALPGRRAEALAAYETALRLNPASAPCHLALAELLVTDPAEKSTALAHARTALTLDPDQAAARALVERLERPQEGPAPSGR